MATETHIYIYISIDHGGYCTNPLSMVFFNFATFAYRRVILKKKGQNVGDGAAPTPCKWCFLDEVLGSTNW